MRPAIVSPANTSLVLRVLLLSTFTVLTASLALPAIAQSKPVDVVPAPAQSKPADPTQNPPAPAAVKPADLTKEAVVFEKLFTHIREEADGTGTRQTTARVRIQADAGVKDMAVLTFTYTASNQQIDVAYVRVIKPDGTIVVTPAYNIQDLPADVTREAPMYSDIHQKHVAVKGLGVGDTLEYQVTLKTLTSDVPGQFWLEYSFEKNLIVLDEQLDLDLPAEKPVKVVCTDNQPTVTTSSGRKLYHWASSNLVRPDPDAPPKAKKDQKPSVQMTTFTSWEQIGAWYASLQKDSLAITPAIQARADQLTKGLTTNEDKLHAIFNDVALHIHYVGLEFGIGRYQPHPADDVLSNEYGDCKDKHTLLAAMLKAAGIEAWPVLISGERELDPEVPSLAQFNHVITLVPLGDKLVWMDSTEEVAPVGVLMATLRDKQALAIPTNKPSYLEHTPTNLPYPQSTRFEAKGQITEDGIFTGHIEYTLLGDAEILMRILFRAIPQSQWQVFLQRYSNNTGFAGEVKDPVVSAIEQTEQPLHYAYEYRRENYSEWDSHRISPPMPAFGVELAPGIKQIKPNEDVDLGSPGDASLTTTIELPKGWTLSPTDPVDLIEDWAEYHSKYSYTDGRYVAERRLVVKKNKVPLADWEKYLVFRRGIYEDEERMSTVSNMGGPKMMPSEIAQDYFLSMLGITNSSKATDDARKQVQVVLDSVLPANAILSAEPKASKDDLTRAVTLSRKAVDTIETITRTLNAYEDKSLGSAALLAYGWSTLGWAALETNDLETAENYLKSAWKLSHDRNSGYLYGRVLAAKGNKTAAIHQYELAHVTTVTSPIVAFPNPNPRLDDQLAASYKEIAGKELNVFAFNRGSYNGSIQSELDRELEIRPFTRASKLTGMGLFSLKFEDGKLNSVAFLSGDNGFASLVPTLQAHAFQSLLPAGSKAQLIREVRIVCSPWAGCDAYVLLPSAIEQPSRRVLTFHGQPNLPTSQGTKPIQIQLENHP